MALQAPLVSWRKRDNSAEVTKWDLGVVDAGTTSDDYGFLLWNNYQGPDARANMEDVIITTKDKQGGFNSDLVTGQWVWVKNDSMNENDFVSIGYNTAGNVSVDHPIKTQKSTTFQGVTSTPNVAPNNSTVGTVCILGVANDGSKAGAAGNFIELTLHARVPGQASAGLVPFNTRATYKFQ